MKLIPTPIKNFSAHIAAHIAFKTHIVVYWDRAYRYKKNHNKVTGRVAYYLEDIKRPKRPGWFERVKIRRIRKRIATTTAPVYLAGGEK